MTHSFSSHAQAGGSWIQSRNRLDSPDDEQRDVGVETRGGGEAGAGEQLEHALTIATCPALTMARCCSWP